MNSRRRTYTAEIPTSLFPEFNVQALPAPYSINARGNRGPKMNCIKGLWDLNIPSELLQEILSLLRLKENIRASVVCKTWFKAVVSVRKLQPRPWAFYPQELSEDGGDYILFDPSSSQTYKLNSPELNKFNTFSYSKNGWLLVLKDVYTELVLLNPFTWEHIYSPALPLNFAGHCLAFSAAPTSTSCLVISLTYKRYSSDIVVNTWPPGETKYTTHHFENQPLRGEYDRWDWCVFSNGMFYCLSICGYLGVFDPPRATWNILPVNPCPAFGQLGFGEPTLLTEHEGDIFVIFPRYNKNPSVSKLNLKRNVWEETRELGGLTVFASRHVSLTRAGLPSEMRNRIYTSQYGPHDMYYYSLGDEQSSRPPPMLVFPYGSVWVDPPHNVNL